MDNFQERNKKNLENWREDSRKAADTMIGKKAESSNQNKNANSGGQNKKSGQDQNKRG
jgi:hypothetical protein